jgi:predicted transcriptional regulator
MARVRRLVPLQGRKERTLTLIVHVFEDATEGLRGSLEALTRERRGDRPVSLEAARGLLTWPRVSLLLAIRRYRPQSVAALAKAMNRPAEGVQRDLTFLEALGVVKLASPGGRSRTRVPRVPYERVEIRLEV